MTYRVPICCIIDIFKGEYVILKTQSLLLKETESLLQQKQKSSISVKGVIRSFVEVK